MIQQLFNSDLPAVLMSDPAAAKAIGGIYFFDISGDGGGQWTVSLGDEPTSVSGNSGDSQCQIKISAPDFLFYMEDRQANGMSLFFSRKMVVEGDQTMQSNINKIFDLVSP